MNYFLFLFVSFFLFSGAVYSIPNNQMDDCISSALNNPATKSISRIAIRNYCDCALTAIIDQGKDIRSSGFECAQKNFN